MNALRWTVLLGWLLMFAAGFSAGMFAAGRGAPPEETYLGTLAEKYDLRPDQVTRVRDLLDEERARIDKVLEGVEGQVKDEIQAARRATQEEIRLVLDEGEQRRRFDEDLQLGR